MNDMYRLEWCIHDGTAQSQDFADLEDAVYAGLRQRHFFDGVEIVDSKTGKPIVLA